jgi:antirestriction protein ArdC
MQMADAPHQAEVTVDIRAEVTKKIVEALEAGVAPWIRPWKSDAPRNMNSGRAYTGINTMLLTWAQSLRGYKSSQWTTFKGAQKQGGMVRKGEKGSMVIFWNIIDKKDDVGNIKKVPLLRYYTVFNREQVDGLPALPMEDKFEDHEGAELVVAGTGARIQFGGDRAAFIPSLDLITMPTPESFKDQASYYATMFHELAHWTGVESRLNRFKDAGGFGTPEYATEELVAEMASAFLCAELGFQGNLQHPNYLAHWITVLKSDSNAIFSANSKATKAADFILKNAEDVDPADED